MLPLPRRISGLTSQLPGPDGGRSHRELSGVVTVITGGAAGIGRATAQALAHRGAVVVIGDIHGEAARRTAEEIGAHSGRQLDVADRAGFTAFLDAVEREVGPIGVLINNAGIMPLGPFVDEADDTTGRIIAINLHGMIHGTREAMRRMVPRGQGHIVNLASTMGKAGLPGGATYSATKFGIVGFCESIRGELKGTGVDLTVVLPGVVSTALGSGVGQPLGIRRVAPQDVAGGIVAALERPRYEVYVPFEAGPLAKVGGVLPQGMRDIVARAMRLDRILTAADPQSRAAYESEIRNTTSGEPARTTA